MWICGQAPAKFSPFCSVCCAIDDLFMGPEDATIIAIGFFL